MAEVVVDTNVLLVAELMHPDVSPECVLFCVEQLQRVMKGSTLVVDDGYRVLGEYQNKLDTARGKGVGTAFLKWALQRQSNPRHVVQVHISEHATNRYREFPVPRIEDEFDPPDRKFPAVSSAHPAKPPILQASDCKWMRWWQDLHAAGVAVRFLCPEDVCRFYGKKFPGEPIPTLP